MSTHIGVGTSSLSDPVEGFKAAAIEVKNQLNTPDTDLVLIFTSAGYANAEALETLQKILRPAWLLGVTTPGMILGNRVETRGVAIMAVISSDLHFAAASIEKISLVPPREAGFNLAKFLQVNYNNPQRSACLYFYDGLRKNGSAFCTGIRDALGAALPLVGAIGLDSSKVAFTQHFFQTRMLEDAAVGLLIGGAGGVAIASRHSWQPLGKPRIIDLAEGNIIRTIDKKPAVSLYHDYFQASDTPIRNNELGDIRLLYPLGIGTSQAREYLIRNPIDILEDGSIVCQGEVPTGSPVHLMITNKDACRQSAYDAALDIRDQMFGKPPKLVLVFESYVRRKILGRSATQGLLAIREVLGHGVPIFGMHTLGEIAPPKSLKESHETQLLNGSIVLLAIG